jgi:hypothetical protein
LPATNGIRIDVVKHRRDEAHAAVVKTVAKLLAPSVIHVETDMPRREK